MTSNGMLAGRVALVTGGNRGIGAGISRVLARHGCAVAINYRADRASAEKTLAGIEADGGRARIYGCDIGAAFEPVRDMAERIAVDFGKLDILVSNAGINIPALGSAEMDLGQMRQVMDANFYGALHAMKAATPHLRRAGRGDAVFISSVSAINLPALRMPYGASKAALEALAITYSKEEVEHGIRANIIRPGLIETEMGEKVVRRRGLQNIEQARAIAPFGRLCQPEDIGEAVAFLCSAAGGYLTGSVMTVDGGGLDWLPPVARTG